MNGEYPQSDLSGVSPSPAGAQLNADQGPQDGSVSGVLSEGPADGRQTDPRSGKSESPDGAQTNQSIREDAGRGGAGGARGADQDRGGRGGVDGRCVEASDQPGGEPERAGGWREGDLGRSMVPSGADFTRCYYPAGYRIRLGQGQSGDRQDRGGPGAGVGREAHGDRGAVQAGAGEVHDGFDTEWRRGGARCLGCGWIIGPYGDCGC